MNEFKVKNGLIVNDNASIIGSITASQLQLTSGSSAGYFLTTDATGNARWAPGGVSGTSGTSGATGSSGTSGNNGSSGTSGVNGSSGTAGTSGTSGSSGTSGVNGSSGTSGQTGSSGTSGTSGATGSSGTSGATGSSGTSGATGSSGTAGTSGATGTSGTSGQTGSSGTSGVSGVANASGLNTQVQFNSGSQFGGANGLLYISSSQKTIVSGTLDITGSISILGNGVSTNIFGQNTTDSHQFTGSVSITGSLSVTGSTSVSGNLSVRTFQMTSGSSDGYTLVSDANGNARWAAGGSGTSGTSGANGSSGTSGGGGSGTGINWYIVGPSALTGSINSGYLMSGSARVDMMLPSGSSVITGSIIESVCQDELSNWKISMPSGTILRFGDYTASAGSGYIQNMNACAAIRIVYTKPNTWMVISSIGNMEII